MSISMNSGGVPGRSHSAAPRRKALMLLPMILFLAAVGLAGCGGETGASEKTGTTATEAASVAPTPGATFSGPVDISGVASSAVISLVVSGDGAAITSVSVALKDLKTETFSAGSMEKQVTGSIPIAGGSFSGSLAGLGTIEGRFASATEANGSIKLDIEIPFSGPADLGEFSWTATAQ